MALTPAAAEHNAACWLAVVDQTGVVFARGWGRNPELQRPGPPGWYVIRTCPCHDHRPVTRRYDTREEAERVRQILLEISG